MTGINPETGKNPGIEDPGEPMAPTAPSGVVPAARAPQVPPPGSLTNRLEAPLPPRRRRTRKQLRHPIAALPAVILFALLSAFFAWQSAEPLWLAVGQGIPGTATVTRCDAADAAVVNNPTHTSPTSYQCVAFEADNGSFQLVDVTLLGAGKAGRVEGGSVPAQVLAADRERVYAATPAGLHLRWSIGLLLVLACGAGITWATGARRLDDHRSRQRAVLLSFAGPVLLTAGFLVAAL